MSLDIWVPLTEEDHARVREWYESVDWDAIQNQHRRVAYPECRASATYSSKLAEVAFGKTFGLDVRWLDHGDGNWDFELIDGSKVDVKSVGIEKNPSFDFAIPMADSEVCCEYYVQVLVEPGQGGALITGFVTREDFLRIGEVIADWDEKGPRPRVVRRSQLRRDWPEEFLWMVMP